MPSASCCSAFSPSSMRTWMMIWLASSRGCDWNLTPIQPWHSLVPLKLRADTVSAKAKNAVASPRVSVEALEVQRVLVVEHRLEARPADVALGLAVDGVADGHVVGGHALGDGARGAADPEEPADDLLPGADLGERAVAPSVEVDRQRLGVGIGNPIAAAYSTYHLTRIAELLCQTSCGSPMPQERPRDLSISCGLAVAHVRGCAFGCGLMRA